MKKKCFFCEHWNHKQKRCYADPILSKADECGEFSLERAFCYALIILGIVLTITVC